MNNRGFTLIELLIVIAIIGILAGAVIISLSGSTERATDATNKYQIGQLRTIAIEHFDKNRSYKNLCTKENDDSDVAGTSDKSASLGDDDTTDEGTNESFEKVLSNIVGFGASDTANDNTLADVNWGCASGDDYWYVYFDLKGEDGKFWCVDKNIATEIDSLDYTSTDEDCEDLEA